LVASICLFVCLFCILNHLIFPSQDTALSEEDMTKYRVHVKTGDKRGAGTDADVFKSGKILMFKLL